MKMTDIQKQKWTVIAANPNIYSPKASLEALFMLRKIDISHDDPVMKEILERRKQ